MTGIQQLGNWYPLLSSYVDAYVSRSTEDGLCYDVVNSGRHRSSATLVVDGLLLDPGWTAT